ncbi:MAG: PKD domain-containing protein [Chitinophagales bacterium]|nr:PKD domain-containing protein [Chitinophagales bacterium]
MTCVPATADFTYSANYTSVAFSSTDLNATSWSWNFGDTSTSTLQNPVHDYLLNGTYEVCLIASNFCSSDTFCQTIFVECEPVVANFTYVISGNTVTFTSTGTDATEWKWKFGDSFNSNQQNPTHTYADTGVYSVCLTAFNNCLSDTLCVDIHVGCEPIVGNFSSTANGLSISFADQSVNATTWSWTFGDGGTSTEQNPTHVYATSGNYEVCLAASNICSADTVCTTVVVQCPALNPAFSYVINVYNVSFTDQSNGATTWNRSFGDGATSTEQNPSHTYSTAGAFNVCLTVNNVCSEAIVCNEIGVECPAITAFFEYAADAQSVIFDDLSSGATSWNWTFGDGGSATTQNTNHTYANGGTYNVCLIVSNGCSSDTACSVIQIECLPFAANYDFTQDANTVQFTDVSGTAISWSWNFGDGGTSTEQNPSYTYAANGIYVACLTASDGCSSNEYCDTVEIIGVAITSLNGNENNLTVFPNPLNDNATISFELNANSKVEISLNDVAGRLIKLLLNENLSAGNHTVSFNRNNLAAGVYLIQVKEAGAMVIKRIVIE